MAVGVGYDRVYERCCLTHEWLAVMWYSDSPYSAENCSAYHRATEAHVRTRRFCYPGDTVLDRSIDGTAIRYYFCSISLRCNT